MTGIRGRVEKDFDDKYLITVFQWCVHRDELWVINHCCFPFKIIISNNKKVKKCPVSGAQIISERRSKAPHHAIVLIIWQSESTVKCFFLSFSPVTTSQLRMKYGANYPIMSEKGSELAGAWLKSNLTLISPNPLAGSNRGFKSYFGISYEHTRNPPRAVSFLSKL